MKAAVCYQFGAPLRVEDVRIDPPGEGEVKVRVAAVAICHSDVSILQGIWGPQLPVIVGHEAAGVVEEVGEGVTLAKPGDRVVVSLIRSCGRCFQCSLGESYLCEGAFALDREHRLHTADGAPIHQGVSVGAFAEYAIVDQSQVVALPPDVPLDRACLLGCGVITGVGAVTNVARVEPGSGVVVVGAGGVGLNSIQAAALAGANPLIALDTRESKLAAARTFGATDALDATRDDLRKAVRALTGGRGADYVFLTVGSTEAVARGLTLLRRGGALVLVGLPKWTATAPFRLADVVWDGQRMLVALYQRGRLKLDELVSARYPLERINDALADMERGDALRNVIVLDPTL